METVENGSSFSFPLKTLIVILFTFSVSLAIRLTCHFFLLSALRSHVPSSPRIFIPPTPHFLIYSLISSFHSFLFFFHGSWAHTLVGSRSSSPQVHEEVESRLIQFLYNLNATLWITSFKILKKRKREKKRGDSDSVHPHETFTRGHRPHETREGNQDGGGV